MLGEPGDSSLRMRPYPGVEWELQAQGDEDGLTHSSGVVQEGV